CKYLAPTDIFTLSLHDALPICELSAEEPYWWVLPDGKNLMALFRDNNRSGYLYRSFSIDNGRSWSPPVKTDFPDARSKFHGLRRSEEHTSELQSRENLVCRLLL